MILQTQQRGFDWSELDLFLSFSEPLDDRRRISCFERQNSIISYYNNPGP